MIYTQLLTIAIFIALWITGGQKEGKIRDVGCPIILALYLAMTLHAWWLFLAIGATYQAIRLGYGNYSPEDDPKPSFLASITHDRSGEYIRALWGLIVSVVGASPLILGHFLGIYQYLGYICLNVAVNYSVSKFKLDVIITDILVSGAVVSIIFFIGRA